MLTQVRPRRRLADLGQSKDSCDSEAGSYAHIKTLQGEQDCDSDLVVAGPDYIAILELIELEKIAEVTTSVWTEIKAMKPSRALTVHRTRLATCMSQTHFFLFLLILVYVFIYTLAPPLWHILPDIYFDHSTGLIRGYCVVCTMLYRSNYI